MKIELARKWHTRHSNGVKWEQLHLFGSDCCRWIIVVAVYQMNGEPFILVLDNEDKPQTTQ